ncbi:MAG: phage holin family protein [Candidatus Parcubacteria bacterium]|nr:phage holin family protein [Candidatus Parcubacteria bacterium]
MKILLRWLINTIAIMLMALYLPGIGVSSFYAALIAALVLGILNALIRPLLVLLTLPINLLTLGLFTILINAFLFWFTSTVVKGFIVAGFWPALWGALIMSLVSWVTSWLVKK